MSSYSVLVDGKKISVKATPMQPVRAILEQACTQLKVPVEPAQCTLTLNKKPINLDEPIRFANIPPRAQLVLTTGQERKLGIQGKPAAPTAAVSAAAPLLPNSEQPRPLDAYVPQGSGQGVSDEQSAVGQRSAQPAIPTSGVQPSGTALPVGTQLSLLEAPMVEGDDPMDTTPAGAPAVAELELPGLEAAVVGTDPMDASPSVVPETSEVELPVEGKDPIGAGRLLFVFTREAAEAAEAAARPQEDDPPPDFYDFTAEDFHRTMASYSRQKQAVEQGLRTSKMREAEEAERAARLGPVPIRINFLDHSIIQADFRATETLEALRKLVALCLDKSVPKWHLYTAPPKQVFRDWSLTLFKAGLVPAAHVFCSFEGDPPPSGIFRPEVAALLTEGRVPPRPAASTNEKSKERVANGAGTSSGAGFSAATGSGAGSDGKRPAGAPKWLKLKK